MQASTRDIWVDIDLSSNVCHRVYRVLVVAVFLYAYKKHSAWILLELNWVHGQSTRQTSVRIGFYDGLSFLKMRWLIRKCQEYA